MDKIASAKQERRTRAARKSFAGRRKAEVVLRVMNGEDAHDAADPSPDVRRREGMMFAILISVLERSYLMYRDQTDPFKREQWAGWEAYIVNWLKRPNFVEEWQRTKKEFDADFARYMDGLIARKKA
ncbi:MAG TPA: hypothetical protein VG269_25240 [Tepidisphaeraceae bacterium]|jgi:hypothetical protein|nr:hypothetical protein [Tepidisphaeraceae bacterium]